MFQLGAQSVCDLKAAKHSQNYHYTRLFFRSTADDRFVPRDVELIVVFVRETERRVATRCAIMYAHSYIQSVVNVGCLTN